MTAEATVQKRKPALAISCTAHIVQDGLTATVYVLLPILAQVFGLSYTQVGLIKGAKSVAQGVFEMGSGLVSERIGEIRTLIFGLVLSAISYVALANATSASAVAWCLLLVGIGTAFQHAPASALVANSYGAGDRKGPLGLYNSSGDVGKLVFTGLFSLAIGAGLAWNHISFFYGLLAVIGAIGIALTGWGAFTVPKPARRNADEPKLGWGILDQRSFSALFATVFLDTMVQAGVLVFIAFLMIAKGFTLGIATFATVALLIGGIFGKAGCGYLAERMGVRPAYGLIQILTAAGILLLVILPGWAAFVILLPLGAVTQGSTSITYGFVADLVHPDRMARGYALMYGASSLSAAAGPFAFGVIADNMGIETAFVGMAIMSLIAIPPLYMMARPQPA